ncbi:MAG: hypothetical protein CTY12_00510 [Methylotenera sp.]|nr:MAG: hypothetical protein CTY12_00510 [Methylotenera sp.]
MSTNSYIITQTGLSCVINGKPLTIDKTHINYVDIVNAIKQNDFDTVLLLSDLSSSVKAWTDGSEVKVDIDAGIVYYRNNIVHNTLVDRILSMIKDGFTVDPMVNLLANLYKNPSKRAVEELYSFLEYGKMPITPDGCFLAYKRVNADYTSCYDSKTNNSIGMTVSMPRSAVDDRSNVTCSHGLHICSFDYLQHYTGARVIIVKVNPMDVVSIPTDYNDTKARVCKYEVIGELTDEEAGLTTHSFGTSVYVEPISVPTVPKKPDVEPMVGLLQDTLLEVAVAKELDTPIVDDWYRVGYTNGYNSGKRKIPVKPLATSADDSSGKMTQTNINSVNVGYAVGYKDGKGHKRRQCEKLTYEALIK